MVEEKERDKGVPHIGQDEHKATITYRNAEKNKLCTHSRSSILLSGGVQGFLVVMEYLVFERDLRD